MYQKRDRERRYQRRCVHVAMKLILKTLTVRATISIDDITVKAMKVKRKKDCSLKP